MQMRINKSGCDKLTSQIGDSGIFTLELHYLPVASDSHDGVTSDSHGFRQGLAFIAGPDFCACYYHIRGLVFGLT